MKNLLIILLISIPLLLFSQGNGQPCSNNCTTCSGILTCEDCICKIKTLPIELLDFSVINEGSVNTISWVTSMEVNNNYYELYRSIDAKNWGLIAIVSSSGGKNTPSYYYFQDYMYSSTINYYRLRQVDFDGNYEYFHIIAIDNSIKGAKLMYRVNIYGQKLPEEHKGLVLEYFDNGKIYKKFVE